MAPIAIPAAIQHERAQRRQRITGLHAPVHPGSLLPLRHEQSVGLFDMSTPDILAVLPPLAIVGNIRLSITQVHYQFRKPLKIAGLRTVCLQQRDRRVHLPTPQVSIRPGEQRGFRLPAVTDHTAQFGAALAQVELVQDHATARPYALQGGKAVSDPARAIRDQQHDALAVGTQLAAPQSARRGH